MASPYSQTAGLTSRPAVRRASVPPERGAGTLDATGRSVRFCGRVLPAAIVRYSGGETRAGRSAVPGRPGGGSARGSFPARKAAEPRRPASRAMRHGRHRRRAKTALVCLALILLCWTAGFYWFTKLIPAPGPASEEATDAIVVLTGGAGRVREGLRLLENGLAAKLFVSGVYRGVDVQALLRHARQEPGNLECCIVLGYVADNTRGNARETAAWIERERHGSLRLVTASYHMPRSLLEFGRVLPSEFGLVAHPVHPEHFQAWWRSRNSLRLALSEYHKYLFALAAGLL